MATKLQESLKVSVRGVKSPEVIVGSSMDPKGQEHDPNPKSTSHNGDEHYHKEEHHINQKVTTSAVDKKG